MVCTYEDIINNIKRILAAKGMKQVVVAERAGFSPQEFSNMLNERRSLHVTYICEKKVRRHLSAGPFLNSLFTKTL